MSRWYARVPKDETENLQWRLDVLREAAGSPAARRYLREACRADTLFYFNAFVWAYDPRLRGRKSVPFLTYPIQDSVIEKVEQSITTGRDLQIEKSRDLGASVICTGVIQKRWCFHRDESFMMFARDADEVDKAGSTGCLFWKIDWINKQLPPWLLPDGFDPDKHRRRFSLESPRTNTTIVGEAMVPAGGVGDRKTAIFIDEFSRIEHADELDIGTADATDCRIFNYTAWGEGNAADRMRKSGAVRKVVMHWSMDPRKNRKLYRWNPQTQRFDYYEYRLGEGDEVDFGQRKLRLVKTAPHEYTDDDSYYVGEDRVPFEPVRDGKLRSPVYDREEARRRNPKWMAVNWDIDYVGSDSRKFDAELLSELAAETVRDPLWEGDIVIDEGTCEILEWVERKGGPLKLWFRPGDGNVPKSELGYGGGSDIARGTGATNSCLSLADADTGHKLAEYVTPHLTVERYARRCVALGRAFASKDGREALLAWEKQGPGEDFRRCLLELGYTNVYTEGVTKQKAAFRDRTAGWNATAKARDELFGEYEVALRERRFVNRSKLALAECDDFVTTPQGCKYRTSRNSGAAVFGEDSGAAFGHGDRVTADALCNRTLVELGRPTFKPPDEEPDTPVFGGLRWRINYHKRLSRERGYT